MPTAATPGKSVALDATKTKSYGVPLYTDPDTGITYDQYGGVWTAPAAAAPAGNPYTPGLQV